MKMLALKLVGLFLTFLMCAGAALVLGFVAFLVFVATVSGSFHLGESFDMAILIGSLLIGMMLATLASAFCLYTSICLFKDRKNPQT